MYKPRTTLMPRLTLLSLLLFIIAACGTSAPPTAPAATATTGPGAGSADTTPVAELGEATIHFMSGQEEGMNNYTTVIGNLSREFQEQQPSVVYEYELAPQTDLEQKLLLLAGSDSLPTIFSSPSTGALIEMYDNGLVLDVEQTFKDAGVFESLKPVAVDLVKTINNGRMLGIPTELNIEGFWYNTKIFADNNLQVPTTWDELLTVADTLQQQGIQPFAASGEQGWPLTRLLGNYAARKLGPDVMQRVASDEVKLTDPAFVEAAQAVQDLGTAGYFGQGVATIDYATAVDQFLQGQAAMLYMGSWVVGDFNTPERNQIGIENIGLFSFPAVAGGVGSVDDWPMNAGLTVSMGKKEYEANPAAVGEWLKYVFSRYGDRALNDAGLVTGFEVQEMPADLPPLTQLVIETVDSIETPMLWFEANFNSEATTRSQRNAALLVTGEMTPEAFLGELQQVLDQ